MVVTYSNLGLVLNKIDQFWMESKIRAFTSEFRLLSCSFNTMGSRNSLVLISWTKCIPPFLIQKSISLILDFCILGLLEPMNRRFRALIASLGVTCLDRIISVISRETSRSISPSGINSDVASLILFSKGTEFFPLNQDIR